MQDFNNRGNELTPSEREDFDSWERELQIVDEGLLRRIGFTAALAAGTAYVNSMETLGDLKVQISQNQTVKRAAAALSAGIASMSAVFSPGTYRAYRNSRSKQ